MTSKVPDQTEDKELLERYRRASDAAASAPSDAVRAAILAESRRVAEELKNRGSHPIFDTKRPAANDSRWKITAFGTMGAALLGALLIAPRFWETRPATNLNSTPTAASTASLSATAPAAAAPPTAAQSDALQEVVVTQANRRRSNAKAEIAATPAAPSNDVTNYREPLSSAAPAPSTPPTAAQNSIADNFASSKAAASPYARLKDGSVTGGAMRSANSPSPLLPSAGQAADVAQTTALLDQGASVDARDSQGRTRLMQAITQGRLEIVRLLLQRGANPNLADNAGKTPLQQATDRNLKDIAALLRDSGAR